MFFFGKKKEYILTPTQELLLALLRAQLWLKPVDDIILPSAIDEWDELINLGYRQTVICFVAKACLRHPKVDEVPSEIRDEFEAVLEENAKIHEQHNAILIELITKFEEHGLHPILLKGQSIAQMYPEPELRQCGDMDLYFRINEYSKAVEFAKSIQDEGCKTHDQYKHYETRYKGIDLEIHRHTNWFANPFAGSYYNKFTKSSMLSPDTITLCNRQVSIPPALYNMVMIFTHMWHHFEKGGINLRQLCDVMLTMKHFQKTIDKSQLFKILSELSLCNYWYITRELFFDYLCGSIDIADIKDKKYREKASILLSFALEEGAYNYKSREEIYKDAHSWFSRKYANHMHGLSLALRAYPVSGMNIFWYFAYHKRFKPYLILRKFLQA